MTNDQRSQLDMGHGTLMNNDLYQILGVASNADLAAIKQSYRRLVREYHPDVSADKLAAHEKLVAIVNAYKTLSDPLKREVYDRARQQAEVYSWEEELHRHSIDSLLTAAELYLFGGQPEFAIAECQKVLQRDPNNPHAYMMLGDIYREMGKFNEALTMYTYAVQLAPTSQLYQRRLEELLQIEQMAAQRADVRKQKTADGSSATQNAKRKTPSRPSLAAVVFGILSILLVFASFWWVWTSPGERLFGIVPKHALIAAAADGFLLGLALPILHWVGHADEELFMSSDSLAGGSFPTGTLIGVLGMFWFYLAIVCYVIVALVQEQFSWSVAKMIVITFALLGAFAALHPTITTQIFLWGGNVIFTCLLIGWSIGSMGRSRW